MGKRRIAAALFAVLLLAAGCGMFVHYQPVDKVRTDADKGQYADLNGVRYYYQHLPGPGEKVLLIHGFSDSSYTWKDVAPLLNEKGYDVWAVDMMGFGWSDKPKDGNYTATGLMEGVAGFMDAVGLERATVVGNSLGGEVAVLLDAAHPEKVERLVLVDAGGYPFKRPFVITLTTLPGASTLAPLIFGKYMVRDNLKQVFYDDSKVTPELVDAFYNRLRTENALYAMTAIGRGHEQEKCDGFIAAVKKVAAPTLIIWGENDPWIPVSLAHRFNQEIPGSTLVLLSQCGHTPQLEKPGDTAQAVLAFLENTPPRTR
ncbi:MAG: alpha/beta hydrolase [Thermodesulfobacteriota bacterium]